MYIVYESISNTDPRYDPKIQEIGKFWHYTVAYIAPEDQPNVIISWLKPEELTEEVAKANKFAAANNGELTVVNASATNYEDIVSPTSGGNNNYKKQIYFLTPQNKTAATAFMKKVLKMYTISHLTGSRGQEINLELKTNLLAKIDALDPNDLDAAQLFAYTYFPWSIAATEGRPKNREFEVPWV